MTIEQIKKEVFYYLGRMATDEEAAEIMDCAEENPCATLDEIIPEYFGC